MNGATVEKVDIQVGTKPSDLFKGVWGKSKKRPSANEVRNEAWQRNK